MARDKELADKVVLNKWELHITHWCPASSLVTTMTKSTRSCFTGLERVLCPRVHFKIIIFDLKLAYIGSANLTGAGLGMKSSRTRNFEAGILTDDPALVEAAMNQFDAVWAGFKCKTCGRTQFCADPVIER